MKRIRKSTLMQITTPTPDFKTDPKAEGNAVRQRLEAERAVKYLKYRKTLEAMAKSHRKGWNTRKNFTIEPRANEEAY